MELGAVERNYDGRIVDGAVKKCLEEYKLQDKVEALINISGRKSRDRCVRNVSPSRGKKNETIGVKDCVRPPIPSTLQSLVSEFRDTVRNSYWNKEIGKTAYLVPNLPAGCDPIGTTFGKATIRQEHGVAEILNPRNDYIAYTDDDRARELYRRSHPDYSPSEPIDRKYNSPFDKFSCFGVAEKSADFTGRKVARCLRWFNQDSATLGSRRLADFSNRTQSRVGKVRNRGTATVLEEPTLGKDPDEEVRAITEEPASLKGYDVYCSVYGNEISKHCGPPLERTATAGLVNQNSNSSSIQSAAGAAKFELGNLGGETTVRALISPNVFTQMGLSHLEFFKVRSYEQMRCIFENIGVEFPDNSFDALWAEGLKKDCTDGVCVETFRNLLGRLAMHNFAEDRT